MTDKEKCPRCNKLRVYGEHRTKDDIWRIFCTHCGLTTGWYDSHSKARADWDAKGEVMRNDQRRIYNRL